MFFRLALALLVLSPQVSDAFTFQDDVAPGTRVVLEGLALAEGKRLSRPMELERIEVYAKDARVLVQIPDGSFSEVERSRDRYFVRADRDLHESLVLAVSADGKRFRATYMSHDEVHELQGKVKGRSLAVEKASLITDAALPHSCGSEGSDLVVGSGADEDIESPASARTKAAILHSATVAVDTDVELLTLKFGGNTANATSYLADLFALMNVFYERDLQVRLLQGHTILRTSETDPYSATAVRDQLNEVGAHWMNTPALQSINRAFVMLLSGKGSSPNSSSGIAWVLTSGSYCTRTGTPQGGDVAGHYSATQVFKFGGSTAVHDMRVIGHELGHNFGVRHTHCTSLATGQSPVTTNTIDQCFAAESGCYSGPVSCPTDNSIAGLGSLMSYCNYSSPAAACGQALAEFHPTQQVVLDGRITTNINLGCLVPVSAPDPNAVYCSGFEATACVR